MSGVAPQRGTAEAGTFGTVDLMSGGRVAWNVVASHGHLEARDFGLDELPARETRYDYADDVVEAVCRLWESWDADALVLDQQRGIYVDPDKVHYVNYAANESGRGGR
jgi:alkanesulfonate monooxygenase SsuD/methylene tetrahydromethanopterin reductase-like flavin-dependent oxidoreductase (luciferase family)